MNRRTALATAATVSILSATTVVAASSVGAVDWLGSGTARPADVVTNDSSTHKRADHRGRPRRRRLRRRRWRRSW